MMLTNFLPFLLLFFSFAKSTAAQPASPFVFEKINGLSQNTVYSIMKDKQGFMWIATADGLNRYDGVEMKIYKPPPEKKEGYLRGRTIRTAILQDDKEQLWLSTELSVFCFNKKENYFKEYLLGSKGGKSASLMSEPLLQEGSHIWFANSSYGVIEFDTATKQSKNFGLTDSAGRLIYIQTAGIYDKKECLWFAGNTGLFAFNIYKKTWQQFLSGTSLYRIAITADIIYASSGKEIFFLDIRTHASGKMQCTQVNNEAGGNFIRVLYSDYQQNTWAGDEKGNVYCKTISDTVFRLRGNINGAGAHQTVYPVYCFYADEVGTLWVGADVLGLLRATIDPTGFYVYPLPDKKKKSANFFIASIYEDEQDKVWLGTFQMGLLLLDKKTGTTTPVSLSAGAPQHLYENMIGVIKKDSSQNLWVGAAGFLFVKEKDRPAFKALKVPLPPNTPAKDAVVSSFAAYKNGWLMGTSLGLYFITKKNGQFFFEYQPELGQSRISSIWIDKKENIWLGFESMGLYVAKDLQHLNEADILFPETGIKSVLADELHELLWISSLSGFIAYHLPTGKYRNFTEADGLGNSYVYGALLSNNNNDVWLSTNQGLSRATIHFEKNNILPALSFTNFTSNDGLPDDEFNTGAFCKGSSGSFYFGTISGVVWFNPIEIKTNHYLPAIVMTEVSVNGMAADSSTSSEYTTSLSLPYFRNNLFFAFRGLEYSSAPRVNYTYKLENWDKDWVYSGVLNEVRYNNLPPGSYIFKVKAANGSGIWNEVSYNIPVIINSPFWNTKWFYLLEVLFIMVIVIALTRAVIGRKLKTAVEKLERQKALEEERHRISQEMHDDIGTGLTQISLISEAAKGQSKSGNEINAELEDISATSRQLVDNIGEIIWSLNPMHDSLDTLLPHLREQLNKLLEYAGIDYNIYFPFDVPAIQLNNKQRRNILLVTKEIVHNSLKHGRATTLSVTASLANRKLKFIIEDNGAGFDQSLTYQGNGLKNIRRRIEELQGDLEIKSRKGEGVIFIYSFTV